MRSIFKAAATALVAGLAAMAPAAPALAHAPRHGTRHGAGAHVRNAHGAAGSSYAALAVRAGTNYLALGDSVTFGYQEPQVVPAPDYADASSFANYPQMLGNELRLSVTNLACPGETTASMIDATAISNGCENTLGDTTQSYRATNPLHVQYTGSQLSYAVSYLMQNRNTTLVTLMIGANDFLICQDTTPDGCASTSERVTTALQVAKNVRAILTAIRRQAHYIGQVIIVNYYSFDYASAADNEDSALVDLTVDVAAKPFHVQFADGYGLFQAASLDSNQNPCTAGLLTQLGSPGTCGIHPTYAGHALLAQAVGDAIAP